MHVPYVRTVAVVLVASMVSGCTGYKAVNIGAVPPTRPAVAQNVKIGQSLRVDLRDGSRQQIKVAAINHDALVGENGQRIAYGDIVAVERHGVRVGRTVLVGLGVYALLYAFFPDL